MKNWMLGGALFVCGVLVGQLKINAAQAEPQPLMQKALQNLEEARNNLSNATTDKGGHRAKAKQLTEEAIEQVKKGIAFDNKH